MSALTRQWGTSRQPQRGIASAYLHTNLNRRAVKWPCYCRGHGTHYPIVICPKVGLTGVRFE